MTYIEAILKVLVIGLLLGAGLPAILLFALVGLVILAALLWITRGTIIHHLGFDPFPGVKKG